MGVPDGAKGDLPLVEDRVEDVESTAGAMAQPPYATLWWKEGTAHNQEFITSTFFASFDLNNMV